MITARTRSTNVSRQFGRGPSGQPQFGLAKSSEPQKGLRAAFLQVSAAAIIAGSALLSQAASAESLQDAFMVAFKTNPTVQAQRAQLRATGELRAQALAGLLPQINAQGSYIIANTSQTSPAGGAFDIQNAKLDQLSGAVTGDQLIFDGLRSINALRQAGDQIDAAEAQLMGIEQQLLTDVATAYFDVVRDMAVFSLNNTNVEVLLRQLDQASVRFRVGEITRTDVAQADARLAGARANLSSASAQLAVSRARYVQLVGQSPATLDGEIPLPVLPTSVDEATNIAREIAPAILIARATERASKRGHKIAKGSLSPTVTATASYQYAEEPNTFIVETDTFAYGARVNVPIFQGGTRLSQIRQTKAQNDADRQRIYEAERQIKAQVISAWEQLTAAQANIESARAQVDANTLALQGVRKEALVGSRSTLDVLNAELEALNSQVALATAERNTQVAAYSLMSAIGLLTPQAVGVEPVEVKSNGIGLGLLKPW